MPKIAYDKHNISSFLYYIKYCQKTTWVCFHFVGLFLFLLLLLGLVAFTTVFPVRYLLCSALGSFKGNSVALSSNLWLVVFWLPWGGVVELVFLHSFHFPPASIYSLFILKHITFGFKILCHKHQNIPNSPLKMSGTKPLLGYWNIRGLAQSIRYLLTYAGVEFDEKLYDIDKHETWFNEKFNLGFDFPNVSFNYKHSGSFDAFCQRFCL